MIYDFCMWLADSLLTVWFFRSLKQDFLHSHRSRWPFAFLLVTLVIYFMPIYTHVTLTRFIIRWLAIASFLRYRNHPSISLCFYFAILFSDSLAAIQSIQPLIDYFLHYETATVKFVSILTEFLGLTIVSHFIPFDQMRALRPEQSTVTGVVTVLILYSKHTTGRITNGGLAPSAEIFVFPSVVLFLALVVLALFDRFIILTESQEKIALVSLSRDFQYQNLQAQITAQDDIRRIYHDMKNHLLSLQTLSTSQQDAYIQSILAEMGTYEALVHTGNATLDGLLHAKILSTRSSAVHLSVNLDLSPIDYLEPIDVCAIFGNIIDNAIEASEQLPEPADRFVEIKSGSFADQLVVRVINSYIEGTVHLNANQIIETTKKDKLYHGIGLVSVRRSVEKYNGTLSLRIIPNNRLLVTILFPLSPPSPP